jgi:cell division transport system permease protein
MEFKMKFNIKKILVSFKNRKLRLRLRLFNAYVVSVVSLTFVLILSGVMFLLLFNAHKVIRQAKESIQIIVIFKPDVSEPNILLFQKELDRREFIKTTEYISRQQGLEEMKEYIGSDVIDVLDFNPLPAILKVNLRAKYSDYSKVQSIIEWLQTFEIVDDVLFNKTLVYQLNKNLKIISSVLGLVTFLFVLIALSLINNTIRLVIYSKRQEIKTMQLVGASDWFILKPFLLNSAIQGLFSGLVADTVIVLGLVYVRLATNSVLDVYRLELTLILVVVIGIVITLLATFFAVKHYLWASDEEIFG